ncbi:hypothetical protein DM558_04360 [Entomomonas moraniae]|uniref:Uncharacterized protein n=1 Tax=Entomomonas moraniae TaxID=2213226 RepID=A0A3S9XCD2_9GAMM|nr:hypothetical protein [Entomomonas moraniae]AZS50055.1 hypothetical protein DM558_04360 [Entomomonas moraniae]
MSQNSQDKTHFRKAFNSPYLSSADIEEPIEVTVSRAVLEGDKTKRSKDLFNTLYFIEKEIRQGEQLKPMILNATNSKMMKTLTGSGYLEDWSNTKVRIYVDPNVKNRGEIVEGLRLMKPFASNKPAITPQNEKMWTRAKEAYVRDGNLDKVLERATLSQEHINQLINECNNDMAQHPTE